MAASGKSFAEVLERFRTIDIPEEFDMIVAIANGGIVPAGILAQRLGGGRGSGGLSESGEGGGIEVRLLRINLRDENQKPRWDAPRLVTPVDFEFRDRRILLVDDRIKSGATIKLARELLAGAAMVKTFAVNGNADYALYNEECFRFPWIL